MIDVHLPTTDGRELVLTRYTEPEPELSLFTEQIETGAARPTASQKLPPLLQDRSRCSADLRGLAPANSDT